MFDVSRGRFEEVIPEMDHEGVAKYGSKLDTISVSIVPEFPPSPIHFQNAFHAVLAEMSSASRRIVNQIPTLRVEPTAEVGIFAIGTEGLVIAANTENRGLTKQIVATIKELRIANKIGPPLLGHAGATPTVGDGILDTFE